MKDPFGLRFVITGLILATSGYALPLSIPYGVTWLDLNADGVKDIIVRTRLDVNSPHPSDRYTLAIAQAEDSDFMSKGFYTVGFEDDPARPLATTEGADCVLTAYAFHLSVSGTLLLTKYSRDIGNSYTDKKPVTKTVYRLVSRNSVHPGDFGFTPYFLQKIKEFRTRNVLCDVSPLLQKD